jgi:polysaccharide pyruvyl transferase WcaK-like protein
MVDHTEPARPAPAQRVKRIAIISPYSGRNLGDGAVHVATIANLRALDPNLELIGLTADTGAMLRLHGISSATLVGTQSRFHYCDARTADPGRPEQPSAGVPLKKRKDPREADASPAARGGGRAIARRIPFARAVAGFTTRQAKRLWRVRNEPAHFVRSIALARTFDLILVCGGGQFDEQWGGPWSHPYALFRWSIIARLTRRPFAMASVGLGILESRLGRFFVRVACAAAVYRSFRDPGTKADFASWGFTRNDPCVPDIVYSLPESMVPAVAAGDRKRRVAVSPMIFGRRGIWPRERQGTYERYLGVLAGFTVWLMERGEDVCFYTSCRDDLLAIDELWTRMQALRPDLRTARPNVLACDTVAEVLRSLATVDLAVTSRLHATVLAHRCGCPVVAISFERKVNADMEHFGHADYVLDIFTFELDMLQQKYLALAANADPLRRQLTQDVRAANDAIQRQNALILGLARR